MCLQSTSSGVVPYLGTYLTVLTMLDTALPDTVQVHHAIFSRTDRSETNKILLRIADEDIAASSFKSNIVYHE